MTLAHAPDARSKRWLAVVLALLMPGLGRVYAGRPLRALLIAVAIEVLAVFAAALATTVPARVVWLGVAASPVVVVLVAVDAARVASHPRSRFVTRSCARVWRIPRGVTCVEPRS